MISPIHLHAEITPEVTRAQSGVTSTSGNVDHVHAVPNSVDSLAHPTKADPLQSLNLKIKHLQDALFEFDKREQVPFPPQDAVRIIDGCHDAVRAVTAELKKAEREGLNTAPIPGTGPHFSLGCHLITLKWMIRSERRDIRDLYGGRTKRTLMAYLAGSRRAKKHNDVMNRWKDLEEEVQTLKNLSDHMEETSAEASETAAPQPIRVKVPVGSAEVPVSPRSVGAFEVPTSPGSVASSDLPGSLETITSSELSPTPPSVGSLETHNSPRSVGSFEAPDSPRSVGFFEAPDSPRTVGFFEAPDSPRTVGFFEAPDSPRSVGSFEAPDSPRSVGFFEAPDSPRSVGFFEAPDSPRSVGSFEAPDSPRSVGSFETPDFLRSVGSFEAPDSPRSVEHSEISGLSQSSAGDLLAENESLPAKALGPALKPTRNWEKAAYTVDAVQADLVAWNSAKLQVVSGQLASARPAHIVHAEIEALKLSLDQRKMKFKATTQQFDAKREELERRQTLYESAKKIKAIDRGNVFTRTVHLKERNRLVAFIRQQPDFNLQDEFLQQFKTRLDSDLAQHLLVVQELAPRISEERQDIHSDHQFLEILQDELKKSEGLEADLKKYSAGLAESQDKLKAPIARSLIAEQFERARMHPEDALDVTSRLNGWINAGYFDAGYLNKVVQASAAPSPTQS